MNDNTQLLEELKLCRDTLEEAQSVIAQMKKEARRREVQLEALKTENDEFKNKFARIENSFLGNLALRVYRRLREFRRRHG